MTYKVFFYKFSEQDFLNPSFQKIADKIPNISKDLFYQYINPLNQIQRGILKKYLQEEGFEYVNYILGYSSSNSLNKNAKKEMDEQFNKMITNYNIRLLINSLKKLKSISSEIEIEQKTYQEDEFLRDNHHIIDESIDSIGNSCEAISKASSHKTPTAKRKQSDASMEDARAPKITKIVANEEEAIEDTSAVVEDANALDRVYLYQFDKDYFRNKFFEHLEGLDDNQFEKVKGHFKEGDNFIAYLKEKLQARQNNTSNAKNSQFDRSKQKAFDTKISNNLNKIETFKMLVFLRGEVIDEGFKKLIDSMEVIAVANFKKWVKEASIEQKNIVIDYLINNGKGAQLDYIFFPRENAIYPREKKKKISSAINKIFNDPSIALLIKSFENIKEKQPSLNNNQIKIVRKDYEDSDDRIEFTPENEDELSYSSAQAEEEATEDTSSALVEDANALDRVYLYQFPKDYFRNKFFNHLKGLDDNQFETVKEFFQEGDNFIAYLKEKLRARQENTWNTDSQFDRKTRNAFDDKISSYLKKIDTFRKLVSLRREVIDEGFKKLIDSMEVIAVANFKKWVKEASIEQKNIVIDYLINNGKGAQLDYIFFPPKNAIYTKAQPKAIEHIFNDPSIALLIKSFEYIKTNHPSLSNKQIKIVRKDYEDSDGRIEFTPENEDELSYSSAQAEEEAIEDTSAVVEDANALYNIHLYQFDKDYFRNKFFEHLEGLDDNQFETVKEHFKEGDNFIAYLKEKLQARKNNTSNTNSQFDIKTKNAFGTKISHYLNKIKTFKMLVSLRREAIDEGFKKLIDSIDIISSAKFKAWVNEASIEQKNIVIDYLRNNGKGAQLDYIFFPTENDKYINGQHQAIERISSDPSIALLIKNFEYIKTNHPSLSNKQIKIVIKKYRDGDDLIAFTLENKDEEDDFYRDIYDVFINNGDESDLELLDDNFFESKTDDLDYQETSDFSKEDGSCSDLDPETENLKKIISFAQTEVEIADSENMMEVVPSRQESIVESLFKAIDHGDIDEVKSLISNNPGLIDAVNEDGNSAVFMSMNYGHTDITNLLIANGFSMSEDEFSSHQRICAQYDNSEELCPYVDENFFRLPDSDLIPYNLIPLPQFEDPFLWGQDNLSNQNEQPNVPEAADPSLQANWMILGACFIASNIIYKH